MPDINVSETIYAQDVHYVERFNIDLLYDDFNDDTQNTDIWDKNTIGGIAYSAGVTVVESGQVLTITPLSSTAGLNYNGYVSKMAFNFTDFEIWVEVKTVTQGTADTQLLIGSDQNNMIKFEYESPDLYFNRVIGGTPSQTSTTYNATNHRWWRIRHDSVTDNIYWDTSPDGIVWTNQRTLTRSTLDITSVFVAINAGTWESVATPGTAVFDNLHTHNEIPMKFDWSPSQTAITPSRTPGDWDYILWGTNNPSSIIKFNGTYFMYYGGAEGDTGDPDYNPINRAIGVATSADMINWTKYGGNPIVTYTSTGGVDVEEGAANCVCYVDGNVIHMWYAIIHSTGGGNVDLFINYRKSIDGYNFVGGERVYGVVNDEYQPQFATYYNGVWSLYIKGPLTGGKGVLSRRYGPNPNYMPNGSAVTAQTIGDSSGGFYNYIDATKHIVLLDIRVPTRPRYQMRYIDDTAPNTISEPLHSFTFSGNNDFPTSKLFIDEPTGKWYLFSMDIAGTGHRISMRTYNLSGRAPTPLKGGIDNYDNWVTGVKIT